MLNTWQERQRRAWMIAALSHFFISVVGLSIGWLMIRYAPVTYQMQPSGGWQPAMHWIYYVGVAVFGVFSFPLLWPMFLLPESWACVGVLLLPLNSLLIGWAVSRVWWWRTKRHGDRDWRIAHWQCPACGYDLTGSMGGKNCPDCGAEIPEELRSLFGKLRRMR